MRGIDFSPLSLLNFETVPTEWYFLFTLLLLQGLKCINTDQNLFLDHNGLSKYMNVYELNNKLWPGSHWSLIVVLVGVTYVFMINIGVFKIIFVQIIYYKLYCFCIHTDLLYSSQKFKAESDLWWLKFLFLHSFIPYLLSKKLLTRRACMCIPSNIKLKIKKYHTVKTILICNRKIVRREVKTTFLIHIYMTDHFLA